MKKLSSVISISLLLTACAATPVKKDEQLRTFVRDNPVANIQKNREDQYAQKLHALNGRNAAQDAQRAIASGQHYLLGYLSGRGGSLKAPGLNRQQSSTSRCGYKRLDGFGDTLYGKSHLKYRVALRRYANQFNKLMYPYCR